MGIDYDAWLEQPYVEQADWEWACDSYMESSGYTEALEEWLAEHPDKDEKAFQNSSLFETLVEKFVEDGGDY